ncbi:MAG: hypothetical protein E7420_05160 [Ruminococcaceae bacterium]|nr:hypothetical protein [Oscillospiraceae bacterium]
MHISNDPHRYDDLLALPHPTSKKHKRMSRENRAAQFSPFAALTGYDALVDETARFTEMRTELDEQHKSALDEILRLLLEHIGEKPEIGIRYFVPDLRKFGGEFLDYRGRLLRIDAFEGSLLFEDGLKIAIEDVFDIQSPYSVGI